MALQINKRKGYISGILSGATWGLDAVMLGVVMVMAPFVENPILLAAGGGILFFISYFSQNDEWKSLVAAGYDREELIAQMQKAHGEFYGKVDKIRIIINPAKFKVSSGRAFHTVSIAYTHNGDADVKIAEVAMMQDGGGNWFVVALPM
mgnify:CR=1 FL=1